MKIFVKVILIVIVVVIVLLIVGIVFVFLQWSFVFLVEGGELQQIVCIDLYVFDEGGEDVVIVVEFFDFECEVCGVFYLVVEEFCEKYVGDIIYVVWYFFLLGYVNFMQVVIVVEVVVGQDCFEDMYYWLFEIQVQWGEELEEIFEVFWVFVEELGFDMVVYDVVVVDFVIVQCVQVDKSDGDWLQVSSILMFFVDGEQVVLQEWDDLEEVIEKVVNG